jgi:hypothetical protein
MGQTGGHAPMTAIVAGKNSGIPVCGDRGLSESGGKMAVLFTT